MDRAAAKVFYAGIPMVFYEAVSRPLCGNKIFGGGFGGSKKVPATLAY